MRRHEAHGRFWLLRKGNTDRRIQRNNALLHLVYLVNYSVGQLVGQRKQLLQLVTVIQERYIMEEK